MAAFTTLAILALAGYAASKTIEAKKADNALKDATAPAPTALGQPQTGAVQRGTTPPTVLSGPGSPTPPDATLAAQNAAIAGLAAAKKQRAKSSAGDSLYLGTPGTSTPPARFGAKTLLGNY